MKRMTVQVLKKLENIQSNIQISMYLPLMAGPEGTAKNVSMLHHAVALLKKTLNDADTPKANQRSIAAHITKLESQLSHPTSGKSLAIFITDLNDMIAYTVPFEVETAIYFMAPYVQLEPLWRHYKERSSYWVLSLSQKGCELFRGFGDNLKKVDAKDIDVDLKTALGLDEVNDPAIQSHTVGSGGRNISEGFHGHGGFKDLHKKYLKNYLQLIDKKLGLYAHDASPVYLMGGEWSQKMFKRISMRKHIVETPITVVERSNSAVHVAELYKDYISKKQFVY